MLFYKTPTTDQPKIQVHLCATVVSCPLTNPQLSFLSQQNLNKMSHFRTKKVWKLFRRACKGTK